MPGAVKILQVNSQVGSGSTGHIVRAINEAAESRGHEAYVAYGRGHSKERNHIHVGHSLDLALHGAMSLLGDAHGLGSRRATLGLTKKIDRLAPDAIGLHNIHGYYLNYPALFDYLSKTEIPVIWTLHDCWAFTGHCSHFVRFRCQKWQTECSRCPMTNYYPKSLVDKSTRNFRLKRSNFGALQNLTIVTPSRWLKGMVDKSFLGACLVKVIPNGINLDVFKPFTPSSEDKIVIGVANVWSESKGLKDFVELRTMLPSHVRIVLIGLTESQIRKLPEGIDGHARTQNREELARWYSRASVFVNPTYADTFPTTNLEALACGTPVVTYETGGSAEAITDCCGAAVEAGNVHNLADQVLSLLSMSRESLRSNCRKWAEARFDGDQRTSEYIVLYESLVSEG